MSQTNEIETQKEYFYLRTVNTPHNYVTYYDDNTGRVGLNERPCAGDFAWLSSIKQKLDLKSAIEKTDEYKCEIVNAKYDLALVSVVDVSKKISLPLFIKTLFRPMKLRETKYPEKMYSEELKRIRDRSYVFTREFATEDSKQYVAFTKGWDHRDETLGNYLKEKQNEGLITFSTVDNAIWYKHPEVLSEIILATGIVPKKTFDIMLAIQMLCEHYDLECEL